MEHVDVIQDTQVQTADYTVDLNVVYVMQQIVLNVRERIWLLLIKPEIVLAILTFTSIILLETAILLFVDSFAQIALMLVVLLVKRVPL